MTRTPTPNPFNTLPTPNTPEAQARITALQEFDTVLGQYMNPDVIEAHQGTVDALRSAYGEFVDANVLNAGQPAVEKFTAEVVEPKKVEKLGIFEKRVDAKAPAIKNARIPGTAQSIENTNFSGKFDATKAPQRVQVIKTILEPAFDTTFGEVKAEGMKYAGERIDAHTAKLDEASDPQFANFTTRVVRDMIDELFKGNDAEIEKGNDALGVKEILSLIRENKVHKLGKFASGKRGEAAHNVVEEVLSDAADYIKGKIADLGERKTAHLVNWLKANRGTGMDEAAVNNALAQLEGQFEAELNNRFFSTGNIDLLVGSQIEPTLHNQFKHLMKEDTAPTLAPEQQAGQDILDLQGLVDPAEIPNLLAHVGAYLAAKGNPAVLSTAKAVAQSIPDPAIRYQVITGLLVPPT